MIQVIAAAVIWGLVLCILPGVRSRKDHTILIAAVAIATALSLNVDPIYLAGDALLGGRNLLDLCANVLMVVGIYSLSQAILRAAEFNDASVRRDGLGLTILICVVVGLAAAFFSIEAPVSSTRFMLDYGSQPAAALYSSIQFAYIGIVMGLTGYVCFRFRRRMATIHFRLAFTLIGIGCTLALIVVFAVLGMDIAHVLGDLGIMLRLTVAYDVSFVGAMLFLCAGLALPPVARRISRRIDVRTREGLLKSLTGIWEKATANRKDIRLVMAARGIERGDASTRKLHRMLVEIQDALLMDPSAAELLDEADRQTVSRTEVFLASHHSALGSRISPAMWGRTRGIDDR